MLSGLNIDYLNFKKLFNSSLDVVRITLQFLGVVSLYMRFVTTGKVVLKIKNTFYKRKLHPSILN